MTETGRGPGMRGTTPPVGRLDDGTVLYAPLGEIPYDPDEDRVQCHLCGGWYRLVGGTHLIKAHGWTVAEYRERLGLLAQDPTCARGTSRRLSAITRQRLATGTLNAPPLRQPEPGERRGRQTPYGRSLAALRPDLVEQLDRSRNPPGLDLGRIGAKSGRRLWWRCPACSHCWQAAPHDRSRGEGCPRCARRSVADAQRQVVADRSLARVRPDLAAELHPLRNPGIDAGCLAPYSRQRVWWSCSQCGHEWRVEPGHRVRGSGCPQCARRQMAAAKKIVSAERSLAIKRPELAAELHPDRNPGLDPRALAAYSNQKVWWLCPPVRKFLAGRAVRARQHRALPRLPLTSGPEMPPADATRRSRSESG